MVAGRITARAVFGAMPLKTDHHRFLIRHPRQTLKQAESTGIAAKEVPRQEKFNKESEAGSDQKNALIARQRGVPDVVINLGRWQ